MEKIKRKDGTYSYRELIRINGQQVKSPVFKRKADAKAWKANMDSKRNRGEITDEFYSERTKMKFKDFAKYWLSDIVYPDCSPRTHSNYESAVRVHLNPTFANRNLRDITEGHIRSFITSLKKKKHNGKGINNITMVMRSIMIRARKERYIFASPFDNIPKIKEELTCDAYWTKKEIEQFLLANSKHYLHDFFFVALHTGMRLAEICGLEWDRVDFANNQLTVTRTRDKLGTKDTTKTKIKRVIPMTASVKTLLWNLLKRQMHPKIVFCKSKGIPVDYGHVYRDFKKAQTTAGFGTRIRFHDLRHTFASQFMMNGGSLFDLQKILGHTDMKMTMRYAHFSPEHLQSALPFMEMGASETYLRHAEESLENVQELRSVSH